MDTQTRIELLTALRYACLKAQENDWAYWEGVFAEKAAQCEIGLEVEGLEEIRPVMKTLIGYDPLEQEPRPKGEEPSESTGVSAQRSPTVQDLRRRIYVKAKTESSWRFWGLYVHVCKRETLREAYRLARANNGAPGLDGITFESIEAKGVEQFLEKLREELHTRTYRPGRTRKVAIPKDGGRGKKMRILSIPTIRDRVVQGALKLILEPIFEADFQPGSFGYRPKRTAHEAVQRVSDAILQGKTHVIDLDLKAYLDTSSYYTPFHHRSSKSEG